MHSWQLNRQKLLALSPSCIFAFQAIRIGKPQPFHLFGTIRMFWYHQLEIHQDSNRFLDDILPISPCL